jgi:hypothetical protein
MRRFLCWPFLLIALALPTTASADEAATDVPAKVPEAGVEKNAERTGPVTSPVATTFAKAKTRPAQLPIYVEDWFSLAEQTQSDPVIFAQADHLFTRRNRAVWNLGVLGVLGGGVATVGTFERLSTNHWTDATKWSVAGGLSVAILSFLTAWVVYPDRADFLSLINEWNLRHLDRPLAP